ncbi:MAG: nickel-responsive transcriptional regulator NikR, partial [Synergistales bacterium]|nr:nickel-responsive transcriptional regulator NikR [Synergistales bacterium]
GLLCREKNTNRSEAIRQLIREAVAKESWELEDEEVYGTITISYDHHSHDATSTLTSIQHEFGDVIICSTHIHVDHDHCLEVIVTRGKSRIIKDLVIELGKLRCIERVSPVITTII